MITKVAGVRIAGISNAVPSDVRTAMKTAADGGISHGEAEKICKLTGIRQLRVAAPDMCASDLAYAAAENLLAELAWDRESIDALVFVSQTHDYDLPATACILQHRLRLSSSCAAFDMSVGCAGYVYGLWTAASLIVGGAKRVLLLAGDTLSRICSPQDRSTAFIFGDGGGATALERDTTAAPLTFGLGCDGAGEKFLIRPGGGQRRAFTDDMLLRQLDERGNTRGPLDIYMDGAEVFAFTLQRVPSMIQDVLEARGWAIDEIDYFVPHQANLFMLNHLAKRMRLPLNKLVISLDEFGNTSCASIPLAIGHRLREQLSPGGSKVVLAGFGVGWNWGAVAWETSPMVIPEVIALEGNERVESFA